MVFVPKTKKLLTRPVLKLQQDKPEYVKIEGPMFVGKEIKPQKEDDKKNKPATIVNVINLQDGSEMQIVMNAVLKSVLTEEYPNETYVGKCFSITKQARSPGKSYNPFHIEEIEDPATQEEAPSPVSGSKKR